MTNGDEPSVDFYMKHKIKPAFYNCMDMEVIKRDIKQLILDMLGDNRGSRVLGFKEVRYENSKIHLIHTFVELFPNTKVICHYKEDTYSQTHSANKGNWWKEDSAPFITKYNNELIQFAEKNQTFAYLFTFEKMFQVEEMKKLFLFLEEPFDEPKYNEMILWDTK